MRKILISAAAAAAVALTAAPAAAQYRDHDRHDRSWGQNDRRGDRQQIRQLLGELDRLEQRIHRSAQRGFISGREAQSLRRDSFQLRERLHRASRDGLSGREYSQIRSRIDRIEQRLRVERRDRDGRRW